MQTIYLLDSSAWIEYFEGSKLGSIVRQIINDNESIVYLPSIVITEVTSKLIRKGLDASSVLKEMSMLSLPAVEKQDYFFEAGKLHAEKRLLSKNFPTADAIIQVLAQKNNAKIVTKDHHLIGPNTILLE